jgi:hypothetical protein
MSAGLGIDQLHIDLNLLAQPPHAAFEDIANAEIVADLLCVPKEGRRVVPGSAGEVGP